MNEVYAWVIDRTDGYAPISYATDLEPWGKLYLMKTQAERHLDRLTSAERPHFSVRRVAIRFVEEGAA